MGAALIVWGADRLTDGASAIALRVGMSEMVVGLTVVSFGTSLPEFIVSLVGAVNGSADICIGNVIGSNLFNTLVIVGVSAMVCPIPVNSGKVLKDIVFVLLSSVLLAVLALDVIFDDARDNTLTAADGLVCFIFLCVFMSYTFTVLANDEQANDTTDSERLPLWRSVLRCLVGLAALVSGGELFVSNATEMAYTLGISEIVVGMTIAAGGTSLPELATSVVAARKGHSDMAIGNVIGSNVFNILLVLGACSMVSPMSCASLDVYDLLMLIGSGVAFWFCARTNYRVGRLEGLCFLIAYVIYISFKILQA